MKNIGINVLIVISSLVLSLAGAEQILKYVYPRRLIEWAWAVNPEEPIYIPDKNLIYVPNPDFDWELSPEGEHFSLYNDNKLKAWQESSLKIMAVGDSFTFGYSVPGHQTYPTILQTKLQAKYPQAQVINAGIPGYGTDHQFYFLTQIALEQLAPDVVVWGINANDVWDNIDHATYTIENNQLKFVGARKNWLYRQGRIMRVVPRFINNSQLANIVFDFIQRHPVRYVGPTTNHEAEAWSIDKMVLQVEAVADLASSLKFQVLLVFMPHQGLISYYSGKSANFQDITKKINHLRYSLALKAKAKGISFLDLNTAMLNQPVNTENKEASQILGQTTDIATNLFLFEKQPFIFGWQHPNETGYQAIASAIEKELNELQLPTN